MIPFHPEEHDIDILNPLNLAELQYSLAASENSSYLKDFHFPAISQHEQDLSVSSTFDPTPDHSKLTPSITFPDVDYSSRRMSSSANSVDTDTSSLSRPEKRPFTPDHTSPSPVSAKRIRSDPDLGQMSNPASANDRVQLPPIFPSAHDHLRNSSLHEFRRASLPTLYSENTAATARLSGRMPGPPRSYQPSALNGYEFPPGQGQGYEKMRPSRLDTQVGPYNSTYQYTSGSSAQSSLPSTISTPGSSFNFASPMPSSASGYLHTTDAWSAPSIVRPNSNPDDRHAHGHGHGVKTEEGPGDAWSLGHGQDDYSHSASNSLSLSAKGGSDSSPLLSSLPAPAAAMAERPKGKRGKLPKPVTDYLKDWLHRHSDHPYPSEDEKKQLCQATGLSMSQVSNWMINARRRILAPAQRAQTNSSSTAAGQYRSPALSPAAAAASLSHHSHHRMPQSQQQHLHPSTHRRASVPSSSPDLQIYYPMSLQSIPGSIQHSQSLSSQPRLDDIHTSPSLMGGYSAPYMSRNTYSERRGYGGGGYPNGGSNSDHHNHSAAADYGGSYPHH